MYFTFLANALQSNTSHRIVPFQTASSNGAQALIAHRLRPDLMYIDASHANPDVFIDLENFYNILVTRDHAMPMQRKSYASPQC